MPVALCIHVRLSDGRYHGEGDWPPCPARLFQALVAAAGLYGLSGRVAAALSWLERQDAPLVAAPIPRTGQQVLQFMPNNDSDKVGGDSRRTGEIRSARKVWQPRMFDGRIPFAYAWQGIDDADMEDARTISSLADCVYQLGRGVDMAWAWSELIPDSELDDLLATYEGRVHRPTEGATGVKGGFLRCPRGGTLESLDARHDARQHRFQIEQQGKKVKFTFRNPPRASFRLVAYDCAPTRFLFELRHPGAESRFAPWPLAGTAHLVVGIRDAAVTRLLKPKRERMMTAEELATQKAEVERILVGRKPNGDNDGSTAERVRIVPLPSIGHPHADCAIRRVLVEVPGGCTVRAEDVRWAFSSASPVDAASGEEHAGVLVEAPDQSALKHYGVGANRARIWRTVTPAVLPESAARRRIEPTRKDVEAKAAPERMGELQRALAAVTHALRHAEVRARVESVRVQREPFDGNGERVEPFASGTRFAKERLWHVEIRFATPVAGPMILGDGRFLGLGLMAPWRAAEGLYAWEVEAGLVGKPDPSGIAHALRRAVMARAQDVLGNEALPTYFTGHGREGGVARSRQSSHLAFAFDPAASRCLVVAPHVMDRREPSREEERWLAALDEALEDLRELRAGAAGALVLRAAALEIGSDELLAPSKTWETLSRYRLTSHAKIGDAIEAVKLDILRECRRCCLPVPEQVAVRGVRGLHGIGVVAHVQITFPVAVFGPLLLGKDRHFGGGLFGHAINRVVREYHPLKGDATP